MAKLNFLLIIIFSSLLLGITANQASAQSDSAGAWRSFSDCYMISGSPYSSNSAYLDGNWEWTPLYNCGNRPDDGFIGGYFNSDRITKICYGIRTERGGRWACVGNGTGASEVRIDPAGNCGGGDACYISTGIHIESNPNFAPLRRVRLTLLGSGARTSVNLNVRQGAGGGWTQPANRQDGTRGFNNVGVRLDVLEGGQPSAPIPAATVDIKVNGSDGPITIFHNTPAILSWTSANATACTASRAWSGVKPLSGSESTGNLRAGEISGYSGKSFYISSWYTYVLTCEGPGGNPSDRVVSDRVTINVSPPTVNIKANNFDGPITIPYNSFAVLSWTSIGVTECLAYGAWTGIKAVSGSESTGNLTANKNYRIKCTDNNRAFTSDSVTVNISTRPTLSVSLSANPSSGVAPLNGVDLTANVSGTAQGTINYKFDCANDGTWEHIFNNISDNPKIVVDACNYAVAGTYTAKARAERGTAPAAESQTTINVSAPPPTLTVSISPKNTNLWENLAGWFREGKQSKQEFTATAMLGDKNVTDDAIFIWSIDQDYGFLEKNGKNEGHSYISKKGDNKITFMAIRRALGTKIKVQAKYNTP